MKRGPKVKISRALGLALTPKAGRIMERRPNPPGEHGGTVRRKVSEYKKQLLEKQRLRAQYNVSERQLRKAFTEATRQPGNTGVRLLQLLESRLDAVVLRAGFARTIHAARQAVSHEHILVNGRKVDRPSHRLRPGDVVALAARSRDLAAFTVPLESARPPAYLELDREKRSVRVAEIPQREQIPVQCEPSLSSSSTLADARSRTYPPRAAGHDREDPVSEPERGEQRHQRGERDAGPERGDRHERCQGRSSGAPAPHPRPGPPPRRTRGRRHRP